MQEFVKFTKRLADISADIIKGYFRAGVAADDKADGTPVTIADKKAEEAMRELIMKTFPAHGIIGEEFENHQPDAAYQWTLDPIDGTKTFITGSFLFGTLIGLMENGKPMLGAINHPVTDQFLLGTNGETHLNGEKVGVRPCERLEDATLLNTTHVSVEKYHDMAAYEALTRRVKLYRTWGDCHGYYLVATGYADIMVDPAMNLWDLVPLVPIIEGAGGKITDWHGNEVLGGSGAVATAGGLHETVIRTLNPEG